jgi:HNH endonuclease
MARPSLIPIAPGTHFGRLTVIGPAKPSSSGKPRWKCRCGCGNITQPLANNLRNGNTKSCGSLCKERNHGQLTERIADIYSRIHPDPISGCWFWNGTHDTQGYSRARFPTGSSDPQYVHRIVYELERQSIPARLELDHLCRNPGCVNPDHLDPVTRRENLRRGIGAETSRKRMRGNQLWRKRKLCRKNKKHRR